MRLANRAEALKPARKSARNKASEQAKSFESISKTMGLQGENVVFDRVFPKPLLRREREAEFVRQVEGRDAVGRKPLEAGLSRSGRNEKAFVQDAGLHLSAGRKKPSVPAMNLSTIFIAIPPFFSLFLMIPEVSFFFAPLS